MSGRQGLGPRARSLIAGLVSAVLLVAAFPPISCQPLVFLALVPLFVEFARSRGAVFWPGFLAFQSVFGASLLFWISSMTTVGWASYAAWLAIAALHLLFSLPLGWFLRRSLRAGQSLVLAAPLLFAAHSFLRELGTGIAWHDPGYALATWTRFVQIAEFGGAEIVGALGYAVAAWIAEFRVARDASKTAESGVAQKHEAAAESSGTRANPAPSNGAGATTSERAEPRRQLRLQAGVLVAVLILSFAFGHWRVASLASSTEAGPRVAGIQPYITLEERADPKASLAAFYERRLTLTRRAVERAGGAVDLVVWPESAFLPVVESRVDGELQPGPRTLVARLRQRGIRRGISDELREAGGAKAAERGPAFLSGANYRRDFLDSEARPLRSEYRNSAFFLVPERETESSAWHLAEAGRYDKRTLVPFGETLPFQGIPVLYNWLREFIDARVSGFPELTPGVRQPQFLLRQEGRDAPLRVVANICYEIVIPGQFAEARREGADLVVNVSNDIWYGESNEMDLVHQQAIFRAIEQRKPLVRVSNTGVSAIIEASGAVSAQAEAQGARKNIAATLTGRVRVGAQRLPGAGWLRWLTVIGACALFAATWRRSTT